MKKRRKTEISLEIDEAISIRTESVAIAHCLGCRKRMRMIAANEAAIIAKLRARDLYRLVEAGRIHFVENANGSLFVCYESLCQLARESDSTVNNWEAKS